MRRYLTTVLVSVGAFITSAPAQQPATAPKADNARIAKLIATLDSAQFVERDRSRRELLALDGAALAPLHQALAENRSIEFKRRAEEILEALAIHEPGGEIVNGLKIRLLADRAAVKPDDTVKLTTILCNMTGKNLNVMVGYTYCGNYFECGSAMRRLGLIPGKPAAELEPKLTIGGFCGTGAGPIYVTVPAKQIVRFETPVLVKDNGGGNAFYALGKDKYFAIEGASANTLRMLLTVAPADNTPRPVRPGMKGEGIRPTDEDAPFWVGAARSNDVQLKFAK